MLCLGKWTGRQLKKVMEKSKKKAEVCKNDWPHRPALLSVKKTGLSYSFFQSQNIKTLLKA